MPIDDAFDYGQSYAISGELVHPMQPVEGLEQSLGKGHVKSNPIVLYVEK